MKFLQEFKDFAMRGNVIDLAVAVVMGTAFNKIISSFVDGIIMPVIGLILGGINIADQSFTIGKAVIKWGAFLQSTIDFTLIAFSMFIVIKAMTMLQKKKEEKPAPLTTQEVLLSEIRDAIKQNK